MRRGRRLLFAGGSCSTTCLQLSLLLLSVSSFCCIAKENHDQYPSPSSCGNIRNISCPFRLKGDHQKCDLPFGNYELACLNNRTILNLPSGIHYYVEDINYDNYSVRVVDPGVEKDNCSSLPLYYIQDIYGFVYLLSDYNMRITFLSCPIPAISTCYIDTASCSSTTSVNSSLSSSMEKHYSYVVVGDMKLSEVEDNCKVNDITWVSLQYWPTIRNASFSDIHDAMVYGFQLPWEYLYFVNCEAISGSFSYLNSSVQSCSSSCSLRHLTSYRLSLFCLRKNLGDIFWSLMHLYKIIGWFLAARFLCGITFLLALLVYKLRRRHLSMYETIEDFLQGQNNLMPIRYSYSEIKKITNNFKNKLGEGGFGTVYKGKLRSGLLVAVKIMSTSKATGQDFINEVSTIGRIHHVNVVQLIGFCFEGPKRALIYEFMPNGSLEKYIFPQEDEETVSLSCEKMYEISFKVAGGIEYLHRGCDMQILHFDIKPHNILLDENFNPKISDFGLAKLYATEDSIVTLTAARGTMGYMAPELFYKNIGGISYKADVYSFGMLLMEMAGRRKNLNPFVDHLSQIYFPSWAYDQFSEGKELEMEDATEEERKLVKKMIIVALWCIQMKPSDRPSMNKVIEMLEGDVELLVMPPKPFLCPQEAPAENPELNETPPNLIVPSNNSITQGSD